MTEQGFYVFPNECMMCGAPEEAAPDLMGHHPEQMSCCFLKQPDTPVEVDQAIRAVEVSCCGAVQYLGKDPEILARLGHGARWSTDTRYWPGDSLVRREAAIPDRTRRRLRTVLGTSGVILLAGAVGKAIFVHEPTVAGAAVVFLLFLLSIMLIGSSRTL